MTLQFHECLTYEGRRVRMYGLPLSQYLPLMALEPAFDFSCTALRRGYVGHWSIQSDELHLYAIQGEYEDGSKITMQDFFPDSVANVYASWYSGELTIPDGELLERNTYGCIYERDIVLQIDKGRVVGKTVCCNVLAVDDDD